MNDDDWGTQKSSAIFWLVACGIPGFCIILTVIVAGICKLAGWL